MLILIRNGEGKVRGREASLESGALEGFDMRGPPHSELN